MIPSYDLRNKLGTQWHWEWFSGVPWDKRDELLMLAAGAGIKHLRSGCWPDDPAKSIATRDHPEMHTYLGELADSGFKFLFGTGIPFVGQEIAGSADKLAAGGSSWFGPPEATIDTIARRYADACVGIEAPNEYDGSWPTTPNVIQPWDDYLRGYIQRVSRAWKADSRVNHLPYVGPSLIYSDSAPVLGDLRAYCDAKNAHPYPGNKPYQQAWAATEKTRLDPVLGAGAPIWATEYGDQPSPPAPPGNWGTIDERGQAVLIVQEFLALVLAGFSRAYIYAFVDTQQNFGLLRNDLSPRPAYNALKKLMSLCDTAPCTPAPLSYTVTGQTSGAHWFSVGNADGSHIVFVFREAPLGSAAQTVHLSFPNDHNLVSHDLISGSDDCPKIQSGGFVYDLVLGDDPIAMTVS